MGGSSASGPTRSAHFSRIDPDYGKNGQRPSIFCRAASSSSVGGAPFAFAPPRPNPEPPAAATGFVPAASAAFSAARLAGLPDFEPFFFCCCLAAAAAEARAGDRPHAGHLRHAALGDGLHHLRGLLEAVDERVDLGDGRAGAPGDAQAARAVEQLRAGGAPASVIDWMIASVRVISRSSKLSSCCAHALRAGQHARASS